MVSLIRKTPDEASVHITLRLRYEKLGALAYISHLDLLRTMTKALLRAGLPLYYSEGFSPHPKLAFAPSLSSTKTPGNLERLLFDDLGERFWFHKRFGKAGILCVLRLFRNALWGQKIRSNRKRRVF